MGTMTIRNIPDGVQEIIRFRAAKNHRSAEAEVRAILATVAAAETGQGFGDHLRSRWSNAFGDELDNLRDKTPAEGADFS
ncbi:Arc family DNA-binding protein [Phyllobacterium salinisoli]|uniref:Arc family DNA-binding protein n=1 Tax=Phyllobacterium salinisoli TaxID=1899321 RepID=A0A368JZR5_9HYPH|nr:Arc family DNA-binding protein [Phyllobacterium salinisoli]RCS21662.1 Arc family DNA-binding protein [Phyllobacterium salinisoli]